MNTKLAALVAFGVVLVVAAGVPGCSSETAQAETASAVDLRPPEPASEGFWARWGDNRGEVSAYRIVTPRYGELRTGVTVLVYVLEEHDRRTWMKNDRSDVPEEFRDVVMKLNETTSFRTGIYAYSVMSSTFSPVGSRGRERFAPVRITFTSQEWCGQVFHSLLPRIDGFEEELRSYFSVEGEQEREVATAPFALYENALLIQLRELDGPFADGGDWRGQLVPSLWRNRTSHQPVAPVEATITRAEDRLPDGTPVNRFTLRYGEIERTFFIEQAEPRRILRWTTSEGEEAELLGTARLTYWQLNHLGDEQYLEQLGLLPSGQPATAASDPAEPDDARPAE